MLNLENLKQLDPDSSTSSDQPNNKKHLNYKRKVKNKDRFTDHYTGAHFRYFDLYERVFELKK